jgi:hypothetical protein
MSAATITVTSPECQVCHQIGYIDAPEEGVERWKKGELIQSALPMLTANEREQLVSGLHPRCWDALMGPDEDE